MEIFDYIVQEKDHIVFVVYFAWTAFVEEHFIDIIVVVVIIGKPTIDMADVAELDVEMVHVW